MNSLMREFRNAFFQARFEGERVMAVVPTLIKLKITLLFISSTILFALSMFAISMGGEGIRIGLEGGVVSCLAIFLCDYLNCVVARGKEGFYDQPFHPDIYKNK